MPSHAMMRSVWGGDIGEMGRGVRGWVCPGFLCHPLSYLLDRCTDRGQVVNVRTKMLQCLMWMLQEGMGALKKACKTNTYSEWVLASPQKGLDGAM